MAELVSVEGDCLQAGKIGGDGNSFKVLMSGMNTAKLQVEFTGPSKPQVMLQNQKDGNVTCVYKVEVAGDYQMSVTFDDDHIEGSPFKVAVA